MKSNTIVFALATGLMFWLAGCGQQASSSAKPEGALFKPTASIQEIMNSVIDPNIDYVWNSVASVITKSGMKEKKPASDEEWGAVRQHALVVLEATNLLLVEGRHAAIEGASTSSAPAELGSKEIEQLIAANRGEYIEYVHALHDTVQLAITAIDAKNAEKLVTVGGAIDHVCEQCHKKFWYPSDKLPLVPIPNKL